MIRIFLFLCVSFLTSLSVQAATHYRYEQVDTHITIEKDATFTEIDDVILLILDEEGVKSQGQQAFYYNSQFDQLKILSAYTLKTNGQKIPIDLKKGMFDQPLPVAADAPMYTEARQISLIFPNLAVGDRIVYRVSFHRHTPLYPKAVEVGLSYPRTIAYDKATLTVTLPTELPLFFDVLGLTEIAPQRQASTLTRRWTYRHPHKLEPERGLANPVTREPHLFITSFPNYKIAAQAYEARAADKHIITPDIQTLANRLIQNQQGVANQARAIYNWVSQNIRYVAVYFGAGGVVPHSAAEVLANRYGDCKDHATLLQTLLKAAGIESSTALIHTGYQYETLKIASMMAFNHAITYIPALNLFVDSTAEVAPFGILPVNEAESPTLLTYNGALHQTPASTPENTAVHYHSTIRYNKKGQADIQTTARYQGEASLFSRYMTKQETPQRLLEELMRDYSLHGTGQLEPGKPTDLNQDQFIKLNLILEDQLILPGPAGLSIPSMYGFYAFSSFPTAILMEKKSRINDFACATRPLTAQYQLTLPDNVEILAIPKNTMIHAENVHYAATYQQKGQTVFVNRGFRFTPPHNLCPASDILRLQPIMREVMKDLKSQIVYRSK